MPRKSEIERETKETRIELSLEVDGSGRTEVDTGIGFLDHMVSSLARHAGFDLRLVARGDTVVDDHHTAEDCAIVLGRALAEALGDRAGVRRFGSAYAPLDESLVRAVVDLSGRPWPEIHLEFVRDTVGQLATENIVHFFRSFAMEARMALHVDLIRGDNDHHKAEAAFKAVALALREAVAVTGGDVPSTKGVLD
ncbi:MAG: imidazoleglycerol-phosphate dehydratase HisB [Actinomycetes bacterium]|jgi:imidazoleglycerol phosphate dehydratase HisB|nr:MAG: imidazoleglycerol-phosphate dehydratase HisB [Actinomycetota bacterium]